MKPTETSSKQQLARTLGFFVGIVSLLGITLNLDFVAYLINFGALGTFFNV